MLARLERYQIVALVVLPIVWTWFVLSPDFSTDPDAYYHAGVARRLLEHGWLRTFEWLPHTTLADPYPNTAFGQHLVVAPLVALLGPELAMRIAPVVLGTAFAASVFLVLRRRGVRWPAPWIVVLLLGCPLAVSYATMLKGATCFAVILPWFVDAIWAGAHRRAFVLVWISVYFYVGATVLVPFAIVHVACVRWIDGRWTFAPIVATVGGLVAGMLVNPLWPAHWGYVAAELRTIFERDHALVPGEFRGAEWSILGTDMLVRLCGAALLAWAAIVVRRLTSAPAATTAATSAAISALGLLAGGLFSGTKLVELFIVFSLLALPQLAEQLAWPRWLRAGGAAVGIAAIVYSIVLRFDAFAQPGWVHPRDYAAMAAWLDARTVDGEMVVAPWDDMPGLFMFGKDEHYMAGYNVQFLKDHDETRFNAYALFYRGVIADPDQTMIQFFDNARLVLVRRVPRASDTALAQRLSTSPAFEELASGNPTWRVWRRK